MFLFFQFRANVSCRFSFESHQSGIFLISHGAYSVSLVSSHQRSLNYFYLCSIRGLDQISPRGRFDVVQLLPSEINLVVCKATLSK